MRSFHSILLSTFLGAASVACSHNPPAPRTANSEPVVDVTQPTNATVPQTSDQKTDQVVNVGPRLREACDIHDVNQAPKFDFDRANLSTNDRDVLAKIATCLTTGPMRGHNVSLVGRADPRGEAEYNMNLGEQRADSVKAYLEQLGVEAARVADSSRGALDAMGYNEDTWRIDRRVDIELAH